MRKPLILLIFIFGLLLIVKPAHAGIILKPVFNSGLVGYWNFDEGAGATVNDKSGYGNHGTWNGTAGILSESFEVNPGYDMTGWGETAETGTTVDEDNTDKTPPTGGGSQILKIVGVGSGFFARLDASDILATNKPITYITFYYYLDSLTDGESGTIFRCEDSNWNDPWLVYVTRSGSTYTVDVHAWYNGDYQWGFASYTISPGQWYKMQFKYDATNKSIEHLVDGVSKASATWTGTSALGIRRLYLQAQSNVNPFHITEYFDLLKVSATGWDQGYWTNGKIGEGASFNGSNDYVEIADTSDLSFGNSSTDLPMTISAWIKMTDASNFKIVTKGEYGAGTIEYYFRVGDQGDNTDNLIFRIYDEGVALGREYTTVMTAYEGQWIHVAVTYDGSGTSAGIKLYLNGVRVDDADYNYSSGYVAMHNLNAAVWVGRYDTYYSNGLIDETRVYGRALDSSEIQRIYKLSQPKFLAAPKNGLVGYWSFEEGTGTKVGDMSGNGNTGTWNGAGSHWADGKFGKGGDFNGSGDYVDAGNPLSLQLGNTGSISLWLKFSYIISSPAGAVISKDEGVNDRNGYMIWIETSTGKILAEIADDDGADVIEPQQPLNDNKWHYVVFTWDGSFLHFYIDNVSAATPYPQSLTPITNVYNLHIGKIASVDNYYFNGIIDEVRIYNRDLDQSEITALYNSGLAKINASQNNQITNGLVGLWSFNGPDITMPNIDLLKEGFEVSPGYDTAGWSETIGAGSAINEDSTAISRPTGGGNQLLEINKAANANARTNFDFGSEKPITYFTVYFRMESSDIGTDGYTYVVDTWDNGFSSIWMLQWAKSGSTPKIRFVLYNNDTWNTYDYPAGAAALGTWYKISIKYDYTNSAWDFRVNDISVGSGGLTGTPRTGIRQIMLGSDSAFEDTYTAYYDLVKVSSSKWPDYNFAIDRSGNGNNGTITGATKTIGQVGQALSFDGSGDYVEVGDVLDMIGTNGITLSAWVKVNTFKDWGAIIDKLLSEGNYRLITWADGTVELGIRNTAGGYESLRTTTTLNAGQWYHLVATFDDSTTGKIYIDGSFNKTKTDFTLVRGDVAVPLRIGYASNNDVYFDGSIDEVRIYNRVLSAQEILRLYNLGH